MMILTPHYFRIYTGLIALTMTATTATAADPAGWHPGFAEAQQVAQESGQPLLVHFHASWCGPCQRMNREVFSQPDVQQQLRAGLAAVEIDVSHQPEIARRYSATTVPRDVVVYPDGTTETVNVGYVPRTAYLTMLAEIAARGRRITEAQQHQQVADSHESAAEEAAADEPAGQVASSEPTADSPAQEILLGLEGYCPVTLHRDREWIKGDPQIATEHHGITYHFRSQAELEEFRQQQDRYAPQNLGCDAVLLASDQQAVTGSIRFGAFFDSRLYLFDSFENRKEFKTNPLRYTRIRHAVKANQLTGQRYQ